MVGHRLATVLVVVPVLAGIGRTTGFAAALYLHSTTWLMLKPVFYAIPESNNANCVMAGACCRLG